MTLAPGSSAPPFDLRARGDDRERIALAELTPAGAVLLAFFKMSCPVCVMSFPVWGELARRYGGSMAMVAVSQDPLAKARPWLDELGFDAPVVDDSDGFTTSSDYLLESVPTLVLIGAGGEITETAEGWDRERANAWDLTLAELTGVPSAGPVSDPADGLPPYRPG